MEIQKPPRRWFRFRLRTLLIMVTVLSVPLGWVGWELDQRRREKAVVAWVEQMGGQLDFNLDTNDQRSWWEKTTDNLLGERVMGLNLEFSLVNDLSPLEELKNLQVLDLSDTQVIDLSPLSELIKLETLYLDDTHVSDLSPLAELKKLEELFCSSTPVNDLLPLAELKNLEWLELRNTTVTGKQLQELRKALPNCTFFQ